MIKKILLAAFLIVMITIAISPSPAQASAGYRIRTSLGWTVGHAFVTNDAQQITVTFDMKYNLGFCLQETHLHLADTWDQIPQENGTPRLEEFEFQGEHDCIDVVEYVVPLGNWGPGETITIAAHAVIGNWMTGRFPDWEETGWAAGCENVKYNPYPDLDCTTYAPYPIKESEEVPLDPEHDALVAIYNSTNGDNWDEWYSNWLDDSIHHCQWFNVTCDVDNHITGLCLCSEWMTGSLPPEIGNLVNLTWLNISTTSITGPIPPELGNLSNLEYLYMDQSAFTGSIPPELGNLTNLKVLSLEQNQLTGPIPPELSKLTNLYALYLDINQLTGPIPPEFGNMTNSVALFLGSNQLTGSIPPELGNSNIVGLIVGDNQLTGSIPPELAEMPLEYLDLSSNQLTGPIPQELGNLADTLYFLHLDNNQLTGFLPQELGNLTNLWELYLDNNQLTGCIPWELGNLIMLETLWLQNNAFSGWETQAALDWAFSLPDYQGPDFVADSCP